MSAAGAALDAGALAVEVDEVGCAALAAGGALALDWLLLLLPHAAKTAVTAIEER
ncbi:MAG: hypothetical protein JO168_06500 [Solirubrobacterales bacterium]|nr:hypothetical protein [Solirubrobacterales bacterium]